MSFFFSGVFDRGFHGAAEKKKFYLRYIFFFFFGLGGRERPAGEHLRLRRYN